MTSAKISDLTTSDESLSAQARMTRTALGVYVHWPYCARICPYCDFNVYKTRAVDEAQWAAAFAAHLQALAPRVGPRKLTSLYFGGGTPSLAPLSVLQKVVETCAALWGFTDDAEITLEANPLLAEAACFADFAAIGVTRLSLGVQAFDDAALKFLGRDHTADDARRAVELGLKAFPRLTFDLIYARPDQTAAAWREELRAALRLGAGHLSLYQLTIEPQTAFGRAAARGRLSSPPDDLAADLFEIAQDETAAAGLPAYEISNHARPGEESRHNLLYWTYQDYLGIGPGAHGRFDEAGRRIATLAPAPPRVYLETCATQRFAETEEILTAAAVRAERLAAGLRLTQGIEVSADDWRVLAERAPPLLADGLLLRDGARLRASDQGRRVLDAVLRALLV